MELLEPVTLAQTTDARMERRRLLEEIQPLADDAIRQELIQLANLPQHYREMNTQNLLRGMVPRGRGKYAWSYLLDGLNYPWLDWIQLGVYRLADHEAAPQGPAPDIWGSQVAGLLSFAERRLALIGA